MYREPAFEAERIPETIHTFDKLTLPERISTILLDLDNTCYHYESCHAPALEAAEKLLGSWHGPLTDFPKRYKAAQQRVKARIPHQAASHSRVLYFQALLEDLHDPNIFERCVTLEETYWLVFQDHMKPTSGLIDFLARHRDRGTKVVVVSDLTTTLQCKKLLALGMAPHITAMVTSEEVGEEKPAATCFTTALEKAGDTTKNAVMIGDNLDRDIAGARALGITPIQFLHDPTTQENSVR